MTIDSSSRDAGRPDLPPLARRAAGITGSVIDSSTSILQRQTHDVIRFAMGSPAPESIPAPAFAELLPAVLGPESTDAFDYGPTEGETAFVDALLPFLEESAIPASREELIVTAGGMQGLDLATKLFVDPGDLVLVESPTYTNGTATIGSYEGDMLEVPTDGEGMVVEDLPEIVAAAGREPSLIYVIPNFQNPSGTTLSLERRRLLLELAAGWDAVILEDDPYGLLRFEGSPLPGLRELSGGAPNVISVHTLSKVLAPGLRLGWVLADPAIIARMIDAKQGMDTCANVPLQRLAAAFIADGRMGPHLAALRDSCRANKEAMQEALSHELGGGGVSWTDPEGGFFLWLTFPEHVATTGLSEVAIEEGVAFIPGSAFSVGGRFENALRLSFASNPGERTAEGVRRLRRALERTYGDGWRRSES
jgi:2-aminoadipate transaminase